MYYCCAITNKGSREHNEDALIVHKTVITEGTIEEHIPSPLIAAVADGVSGEKSGELASGLCLKLLSDVKYSHRTDLSKIIMHIHEALVQYGLEHREFLNMQTTLCGIAIDETDRITFFNVGDSRLYRYRNGHLRQLTRDQSLVQLLYEEGTITQAEKHSHSRRNIIFPVLGNVYNTPDIDINITGERMKYGDVILICSDGLTDYISNNDIEQILGESRSMTKRLATLLDLSLSRGSRDNVSIIAISYYEE